MELLIEALLPLIVALMLSLKSKRNYGEWIILEELSILNNILPIAYALALSGTSRSIMIQLVEEKSKRYKET